MKNEKTSIKNILCVPYTPTLWLYYVNDGERHAVSDEQLNKLLTSVVPSLVYKVLEKMSRHIPFFIDVEKVEFQEVAPDVEEDYRKMKSDLRKVQQKELYKVLNADKEVYMPKFTKEKESIFDSIMKKLHKE